MTSTSPGPYGLWAERYAQHDYLPEAITDLNRNGWKAKVDKPKSGGPAPMNTADYKAHLVAAYAAPIKLASRLEFCDVYARGDVMLVVPGLFLGASPELLAALVVRRVTTLSGRCPACDETGPGAIRDQLIYGAIAPKAEFIHDSCCPGTMANLRRLGLDEPGSYVGERLHDPDPLSRYINGRELHVLDGQGRVVWVFELDLSGGAG